MGIGEILSLLLLIATFLYVILTAKTLKINTKTFIETTRPSVLLSFNSEDGWLNLLIKNYGKTPAYDLNIEIDPPLDSIDMFLNKKMKEFQVGHKPLLKQEFLPPDFEVKTTLMYSQDFVEMDELPRVYNIKLEYYDCNEKEKKKRMPYNHNYTINISSIVYPDKIRFNSIEYQIGEINKTLKNISDKISK